MDAGLFLWRCSNKPVSCRHRGLDAATVRSYMMEMQEAAEKRGRELAWGIAGSVLLHIALVVFLLVKLPFPSFEPPKEEAVSVEMVPEPEPQPKPEEKKEEPPPPPPPAAPPPKPEPEPQVDKPEPPPPAPTATMLALPPPVSDAPERDDAQGDDKTAKPDAPISTGQTAPEKADEAQSPEDRPEDKPPDTEPASTPDPSTEPATGDAETDAKEQAPDILKAEGASGADAKAEDAPPVPAPKPDAPVQKTPAAPPAAALKPAKKLLANARLSDPTIREALGQLPLPRRIVQLCTFEALSQIMAHRPGTMLHGMVPFGDKDGRITDNTLDASGGAYRTVAGDWYDISFHCSVDPEKMTVTGFNYHIGEKKITRAERIARGLPRD